MYIVKAGYNLYMVATNAVAGNVGLSANMLIALLLLIGIITVKASSSKVLHSVNYPISTSLA
jgi:hypothetical protein